jgi:hypothetical protein
MCDLSHGGPTLTAALGAGAALAIAFCAFVLFAATLGRGALRAGAPRADRLIALGVLIVVTIGVAAVVMARTLDPA